jgi:hypothetical protein
MSRPSRGTVWLFLTVLGLGGCAGLRLHDAGRLQTASEATKLAAELSRTGGGVFTPMEENLDAVRDTQGRLRRLTEAHERETFLRVLARADADTIARRLVRAMRERNDAFRTARASITDAAVAVNAALDRQQLIVKQLQDTPKTEAGQTLLATIARVNGRLKWLDELREGLADIGDRPASGAIAGAVANTGKAAATDTRALGTVLAAAQDVLDGVEKDERVGAALQLVRRAAEQTAAAEQSRLLEIRRYLSELQRLRDGLLVRDTIVVCELLLPVVDQVYPGASELNRKDLEAALGELRDSGRYDEQCPTSIRQPPTVDPDVQGRWSGKSLAAYVAARFADDKTRPAAERPAAMLVGPRLVAGLGILLFHEAPFLRDTRLELDRARHRHSIRLSAVNAQQRVELVHQLGEGLEIYHRGGIKPEAVAELILMAAQVGALGFIGAQQ